MPQQVVQVLRLDGLVADETVGALADHAQTLLHRFFEGAADGHHLADALHARADLAGHALELVEVPARNLADHVVQRRLEERRRRLGDGVLELVEAVAQTDLGGDEGEGIARGLGGQRGRAAEAGVDLDHAVVLAVGAEGVLDVALADDADVAHDVDGLLAEEVALVVGQGLAGSDHDALTGVDAERVEILHVADRDAVVVAVAHHLELDLLPAPQGLLDEHLGREGERLAGDGLQLSLVLAETGTQAAQRVGGTQDHRVADLAGGGAGLLQVGGRVRLDRLDVDLVHALHEEFAVFGVDDGLHRGAEHLDAVGLEDTVLVELHAAVEGGLSAEGEQDPLRLLLLDHLLDEERRDGQEVDLIGNSLGSLDRGDIGIDENGLDALFAEGFQGLRAAVVEFAGLADLEGARSEHQYFLDCGVDHNWEIKSSKMNSVSSGPLEASGWNWAEKNGLDLCRIPSLVPSFMLMK